MAKTNETLKDEKEKIKEITVQLDSLIGLVKKATQSVRANGIPIIGERQ